MLFIYIYAVDLETVLISMHDRQAVRRMDCAAAAEAEAV